MQNNEEDNEHLEAFNISTNYVPKQIIEHEDAAYAATYDIGRINGHYAQTIEELFAKEFSDDIWLVEGLIPVSATTVLSALPGSFKTWLLLEIAKCVASGKELFGQFASKQTGVLILDEENGERVLQQRLKKLGAEAKSPIYYFSDIGVKIEEDTIPQILEFCQNFEVGLVTLDSLIRVHDANENDAKEMAAVFHLLKQLNSNDITVLATHHNRKPSGSGGNPAHEMRGSSDILAALDCHLALSRRDKNELVLTQTKVRLAEELPPLELTVSSDENKVEITYMGTLAPSESKRETAKFEIMEALVAHKALNQREILAELAKTDGQVNPRTLRSILESMVEAELIVKSKGDRNSIIYRLADSPDEPEEE